MKKIIVTLLFALFCSTLLVSCAHTKTPTTTKSNDTPTTTNSGGGNQTTQNSDNITTTQNNGNVTTNDSGIITTKASNLEVEGMLNELLSFNFVLPSNITSTGYSIQEDGAIKDYYFFFSYDSNFNFNILHNELSQQIPYSWLGGGIISSGLMGYDYLSEWVKPENDHYGPSFYVALGNNTIILAYSYVPDYPIEGEWPGTLIEKTLNGNTVIRVEESVFFECECEYDSITVSTTEVINCDQYKTRLVSDGFTVSDYSEDTYYKYLETELIKVEFTVFESSYSGMFEASIKYSLISLVGEQENWPTELNTLFPNFIIPVCQDATSFTFISETDGENSTASLTCFGLSEMNALNYQMLSIDAGFDVIDDMTLIKDNKEKGQTLKCIAIYDDENLSLKLIFTVETYKAPFIENINTDFNATWTEIIYQYKLTKKGNDFYYQKENSYSPGIIDEAVYYKYNNEANNYTKYSYRNGYYCWRNEGSLSKRVVANQLKQNYSNCLFMDIPKDYSLSETEETLFGIECKVYKTSSTSMKEVVITKDNLFVLRYKLNSYQTKTFDTFITSNVSPIVLDSSFNKQYEWPSEKVANIGAFPSYTGSATTYQVLTDYTNTYSIKVYDVLVEDYSEYIEALLSNNFKKYDDTTYVKKDESIGKFLILELSHNINTNGTLNVEFSFNYLDYEEREWPEASLSRLYDFPVFDIEMGYYGRFDGGSLSIYYATVEETKAYIEKLLENGFTKKGRYYYIVDPSDEDKWDYVAITQFSNGVALEFNQMDSPSYPSAKVKRITDNFDSNFTLSSYDTINGLFTNIYSTSSSISFSIESSNENEKNEYRDKLLNDGFLRDSNNEYGYTGEGDYCMYKMNDEKVLVIQVSSYEFQDYSISVYIYVEDLD